MGRRANDVSRVRLDAPIVLSYGDHWQGLTPDFAGVAACIQYTELRIASPMKPGPTFLHGAANSCPLSANGLSIT